MTHRREKQALKIISIPGTPVGKRMASLVRWDMESKDQKFDRVNVSECK